MSILFICAPLKHLYMQVKGPVMSPRYIIYGPKCTSYGRTLQCCIIILQNTGFALCSKIDLQKRPCACPPFQALMFGGFFLVVVVVVFFFLMNTSLVALALIVPCLLMRNIILLCSPVAQTVFTEMKESPLTNHKLLKNECMRKKCT